MLLLQACGNFVVVAKAEKSPLLEQTEEKKPIKSIKKDDEKTNNNKNEIHCSFE
jgi:hypothetical protein